jgi:DNA-binding response OmpR family regulator
MRDKKVLVIEADPYLLQVIEHILSSVGAQVFTADGGESGVQQVLSQRPHLVILSEELLHEDAWEVCKRISRHKNGSPIIMLTTLEGKPGTERKSDAFVAEYIARSFKPDELLTRATKTMSQAHTSPGRRQPITFSDDHLTIDLDQHHVMVCGEPVRLSAAEYRLLAFLLRNAGQVCTTQQILDNVWGYRDCVDYVHVCIWHLRQKLEKDPEHPRYLLSKPEVGYGFQNQPYAC